MQGEEVRVPAPVLKWMDLDARRGRGVEDDLGLRGRGRQRLVDDHVQATPGRFEGKGDMGAVR